MDKSENRLQFHNGWSRYETPAAVRKHGREFLERMWAISNGRRYPDPSRPARRLADRPEGGAR